MRYIVIAVAMLSLLLPAVVLAQEKWTAEDEAECVASWWPEPPATIREVREVLDYEGSEYPGLSSILYDECIGWRIYRVNTTANRVNVRQWRGLHYEITGTLAASQEIMAKCDFQGDEWQGSMEWCLVESESAEGDGGFVHRLLLDYVRVPESKWAHPEDVPTEEQAKHEDPVAKDEAECIASWWPETPETVIEVWNIDSGEDDEDPGLVTILYDECAGWRIYRIKTEENRVSVRKATSQYSEITRYLKANEEVRARCGMGGVEWNGSTEWCELEAERKPLFLERALGPDEGGFVHRLQLDYVGLAESRWEHLREEPTTEG